MEDGWRTRTITSNCILTEIRNEMTTANPYRMKHHKQIQLETGFIQLEGASDYRQYLKANYTNISQFTWPVVRQAIFEGGSSSISAYGPKTATEIDSRRVTKREYPDALDNSISIYSM